MHTYYTVCMYLCVSLLFTMQSIYYTLYDGYECVWVKKWINPFTVRHMSVQCFNMISACKSVAIRIIGLGDTEYVFSYQLISIYVTIWIISGNLKDSPTFKSLYINPQVRSLWWLSCHFLCWHSFIWSSAHHPSIYWSFETRAVACGVFSSTQTTLFCILLGNSLFLKDCHMIGYK